MGDRFSDLTGVLGDAFTISPGKATIDSSAIAAPYTLKLPAAPGAVGESLAISAVSGDQISLGFSGGTATPAPDGIGRPYRLALWNDWASRIIPSGDAGTPEDPLYTTIESCVFYIKSSGTTPTTVKLKRDRGTAETYGRIELPVVSAPTIIRWEIDPDWSNSRNWGFVMIENANQMNFSYVPPSEGTLNFRALISGWTGMKSPYFLNG